MTLWRIYLGSLATVSHYVSSDIYNINFPKRLNRSEKGKQRWILLLKETSGKILRSLFAILKRKIVN